jgi:hypothetical protein
MTPRVRKQRREALVCRSTPDSRHRNTLVIRTLTVEIFVDKHEVEEALCDFYQLVSRDGAYDRTLERREAEDLDETWWVLTFTDVLPGRTYSLYHLPGEGVRVGVFLDVPVGSLDQYGPDTSAPPLRNAQKLPPEPDPEVVSGIQVVMNNDVNRRVDVNEYEPDPHADVLALA